VTNVEAFERCWRVSLQCLAKDRFSRFASISSSPSPQLSPLLLRHCPPSSRHQYLPIPIPGIRRPIPEWISGRRIAWGTTTRSSGRRLYVSLCLTCMSWLTNPTSFQLGFIIGASGLREKLRLPSAIKKWLPPSELALERFLSHSLPEPQDDIHAIFSTQPPNTPFAKNFLPSQVSFQKLKESIVRE
jgi:hypothetical protein